MTDMASRHYGSFWDSSYSSLSITDDACASGACVGDNSATNPQTRVTASSTYAGQPSIDTLGYTLEYVTESYDGITFGVDANRSVKMNLPPQLIDGEMTPVYTTTFGKQVQHHYLPLYADVENDEM